jgi:protocatechuate 3,4-dioxygenase beta subunit
MARSLALLLLVLVALQLASAQSPPASAKKASIAGMVVKEPGSEPLKKVVVQIVAENQRLGGNYTAATDSNGHFQVDNVEPGRYRIFFEKSGFIGVNDRGAKADTNVFSVQAGQTVDNLLFRMLPTAVISGRITDEDGEPMSEVRIIAQMKKAGKVRNDNGGSTATNDLGEYRLAGLFPGQYSIAAIPPPDFRDYQKPDKDKAADAPPETRYVTTYYPGTFDAAQASTVALTAGDDVPVNFTLVPARTYRVRGIVTGMTGTEKPSVELRSKSGDSYHTNAVEIGPNGQFEVRGVAPGSYSLVATVGSESHTLSAQQDINVVAGDVDGLKITPLPSFTLSGHLHVEGASSANLTHYAVNLRLIQSSDDSTIYISPEFFGVNAAVDKQGNFQWQGVAPGNYTVQVIGGEPPGFFLKSATVGGRDIETGFAASGPTTLDITVSYKGGSIEGTVEEKEKDVGNTHPVSGASVVAIPEEKYRKLSDHFGTGETDQNGHFLIRGLAPGNYTLYAWQDIDESEYRDPEFLKTQDGNGMAVKVEETSRQQVQLKLSPVAAEWR